MIVICDKAQDVIIPAGLGDNPGVVYEKSGVESLNGQQGDLTLKTVNGNELLGEGNIEIKSGVESVNGETGAVKIKSVNGTDMLGEGNVAIDTGVESLNGQKGALSLKTVNGNELLGEGDINIKALKYFELTQERAQEAYYEIQNHWDDKSGYTGDFIFYYKKNDIAVYTFNEMGYIKDHSIYFSWLDNAGAYDINGNVKCFAIIIWKDGYNLQTYEQDFAIPTKTSQLTNDSAFQTKSEVDTAIENAISGVGGVESVNGETGAVKIKSVNGQSLVGDGDVQIQAGLKYFELTADKAKEAYDEVVNHWDSLSGYTGDYVFTYNNRKDKIANYYFVKITHIDDATGNYVLFSCVDTDAAFNYNDSTIKIFSVIVYNNNNGANYRLRTYYNSFPIPTKTSQLTNDSGFLDELGMVETFTKYELYTKALFFFNDPTRDPNAPNAHNANVFRIFESAIADNAMTSNFFIVNGSAESGQTPYSPILQVLRKEEVENGVWGGNKGYYVFAGQKNSENADKLQVHMYCLTDIGGVIDYGVNALDGGTWTSGVHSKIDDVLTAGQDIPFVFEYLEGCDETYFWADNMGGKQGLYNITFNGGYDGYKGNVVADVYGNDTGVYMAFTVNNVRYTYKKNDTNSKWQLAKSVQIGGVQSAEVSNIKVLTQSEYDALEPKDPNTMYCIKGQ